MMTTDEFLKEIEASGLKFELLDWTSVHEKNLLRDDNGRCPITALCAVKRKKAFTNAGYMRAAQELGLEGEDAVAIMRAADYEDDRTAELRPRLLAACGVVQTAGDR